ncbi:probable glycosyltransferase At5g25310 [Gastrolobium bilobum]|uniref:probable glycosyltransferase At5g25310 n=1 Tax=Gastrolobium bilobum TaxID=150636 RepID=UPI002AB17225|nr:probable glycosyltransferase At5g25310 [Gastrolobium bilobum]
MGQEFWSLFQLETKKLLWFIGTTFAVIIAFQYLELPYGNVVLPLFSAGKIPTSGSSILQATDPLSESEIVNNVTILNGANSIGENALEIANKTRMPGEKDTTPRTGFVLEPESPQNKSLGYDDSYAYSPSPSPEKAPSYLTPPFSPTTNVTPNVTTALLSNDSKISSLQKDNITNSIKEESFRPSQNDGNILGKNSSINTVPKENQDSHIPIPEVTSISEMSKLLLQSHASYRSMRPRWFSAVDQELLQARSEIENAPIVKNDPNLYAPLYQNVSMFKRSYELMEKTLKVFVYREGARPILHSPFLTGIYASEGWFMKLMEANKRFVTKDPKKAHLFYLPFSSRMLEETLYIQGSHSHKNLIQYLDNYVDMIAGKHPFWNRTEGADHFLVACHDWAPAETKVHMAKCIKALCNADVKEGFVFGKDASLPETYVRNAQNPTRELGGNPASKKTTLAFFAGKMHGYVRPILLQHWENKDPEMKIFGKMPKSKGNKDYIQYMKSSKYCICAKGYEVNSPRVVEAIFYECVPVIISDNFVPPFFEVLNWESFAVIVQQHFLWHKDPVKYDIFHMILHSIWYNRVFSAPAT